MGIDENLENYVKWPNANLRALANSSVEFENLMEIVTDYRNSVSNEVKGNFRTLDEIIDYVKNYDRSNGEIRVRFNGNWVYSINIDQEDYYIELIGHTREKQIELEQRSFYSNRLWFAEKRQDAIENLQRRKDEGKKYIIPEKHKSWEERVEDLTDINDDIYLNSEVDKTIEILKILSEDDVEILKILNKDKKDVVERALDALLNDYVLVDRLTFAIVKLVTIFSSKGIEFANGYLNLLKEHNVGKDCTSGVNKLIAHTKAANRLISKGAVPELVVNKYYSLYYMPIIFEDGVHDIYLVEKEEGIYEGTLNDNLVIVRTDDDYMYVRIIIDENIFSYKVPVGNKPVRVDEYCNATLTGNKALIYFNKVNNDIKALNQAVMNDNVSNNTKMPMLVKGYLLHQ